MPKANEGSERGIWRRVLDRAGFASRSENESNAEMTHNGAVDKDRIVDFMLAEYETLRDFRQTSVTLGENRLNFYLACVSGAAVGLGLDSAEQKF